MRRERENGRGGGECESVLGERGEGGGTCESIGRERGEGGSEG